MLLMSWKWIPLRKFILSARLWVVYSAHIPFVYSHVRGSRCVCVCELNSVFVTPCIMFREPLILYVFILANPKYCISFVCFFRDHCFLWFPLCVSFCFFIIIFFLAMYRWWGIVHIRLWDRQLSRKLRYSQEDTWPRMCKISPLRRWLVTLSCATSLAARRLQ